jgi:hypothetical protein
MAVAVAVAVAFFRQDQIPVARVERLADRLWVEPLEPPEVRAHSVVAVAGMTVTMTAAALFMEAEAEGEGATVGLPPAMAEIQFTAAAVAVAVLTEVVAVLEVRHCLGVLAVLAEVRQAWPVHSREAAAAEHPLEPAARVAMAASM